jgi:hypothetical protein
VLKNPKQTGFAHILILLAIVGLITFFFVSRSADFKDKLFGSLFPKPSSHASEIRGQSGDRWADIVIGQRDFTEINPNEIVADKLFNAGGMVVDNNIGKAYIWDSNNSRILGIDLADCYAKTAGNRCAAQLVIGQPSLGDWGACNHDSSLQSTSKVPASADSLCGVPDTAFSLEEQRSKANMAIDSAGNLYVPDMENNRVLMYKSPFTTDTIADAVWGQDDFAGNLPNKGGSINDSTLSFDFAFYGSGGLEKHGAVAIDAQGNLWVADTGNNRILRFPKQSDQISKVADIVIGQSSKTSANSGSGLNQLKYPSALTFDTNGKLYVADSGNTRILAFASPFAIGMSGTTFGSDFAHNQPYSSNCNTSVGGYTGAYTGCDGNPWDVQLDPQGQGIWTYETTGWDSRVRLWSFNNTLLKSIDNTGSRGGGSLGLDKSSNILVTVGFSSDVSRFQKQSDGNYSRVQSFFSPPGGHNLLTGRRLKLTALGGLAVVGDQLAVADGRLLFWNGLNSLTNGKAADGYLRTSLSDNIQGFTDLSSTGVNYIKSSADKLWVIVNDRILIYQTPLSTGEVT